MTHLSDLTLSTDPVSGERHLRHQMTADGFYKGRLIKDLRKPLKEVEDTKPKTNHVFFAFLAFPVKDLNISSCFSKGGILRYSSSSEYSPVLNAAVI